MLRASIRSAIKKYAIKHGLKILDDPNHHKMMRKELCMNIFPFGNDGADPSIIIKLVFNFLLWQNVFNIIYFKLTAPTCLLDAGIYRLYTVTSILRYPGDIDFDYTVQLFVNPKFVKVEKEAQFYSGTFKGKVNFLMSTIS